jgi:hypothetical protein
LGFLVSKTYHLATLVSKSRSEKNARGNATPASCEWPATTNAKNPFQAEEKIRHTVFFHSEIFSDSFFRNISSAADVVKQMAETKKLVLDALNRSIFHLEGLPDGLFSYQKSKFW